VVSERHRPALSRGDVWHVDFGDPVGHEQGFRRPAIIISSDRFNQSWVERVVVVPLTRTKLAANSHVEVEPGPSGLKQISYATVEDVRSVSVDRLIHHRGAVGSEVLIPIGQILGLMLELR
jgi:mRNA interferase MazF